MSTDKKEEGTQVNEMPDVKKAEPTKAEKVELQKQENERRRHDDAMRKNAIKELADYKKRLRSSNELKELQVQELKLNIAYYENKKLWMDLGPKMEELEAKEKAMQAEQMERRKKEYEDSQAALKVTGDDKPTIILPKVGKARKSEKAEDKK